MSIHASSRRRALATLSCMAIAGTISPAYAQAGGSLFWRIAARFPLYGIAGFVLWKVLDGDSAKPKTATAEPLAPAPSALETAEQVIARRRVEELEAARVARKPHAVQLARHMGIGEALADNIVEAIGVELAQRIVKGRLAVWPQRDASEQRILDIALENRSGQPITGAMQIAIDDVETGAREFDYRYHGYLVEPHRTLHVEVPFLAPFRRSGLKRISLINQPHQVVVSAAEVFVLPGEIRRA